MKKTLLAAVMIAVATMTVISLASFKDETHSDSAAQAASYRVWADNSGNIRYSNTYDHNINCKVQYRAYWNTGEFDDPKWESQGTATVTRTLSKNTTNGFFMNTTSVRQRYEVIDYDAVE